MKKRVKAIIKDYFINIYKYIWWILFIIMILVVLALLDFGFCILDFQVVLDFVCWILKSKRLPWNVRPKSFTKFLDIYGICFCLVFVNQLSVMVAMRLWIFYVRNIDWTTTVAQCLGRAFYDFTKVKSCFAPIFRCFFSVWVQASPWQRRTQGPP